MMIEAPQIVLTEDEHYAFIHLKLPREEMRTSLPPALKELHSAFQEQALPILPWFAHHLTLSDGDFDFEVCLPVPNPTDKPFAAAGRIRPGLWPAGAVARTFYTGDYPGLPAAWGEFSQWLRDNDHAYAGHIYERYVVNRRNTQNPAEFRTEMSWPLTTPSSTKEQA